MTAPAEAKPRRPLERMNVPSGNEVREEQGGMAPEAPVQGWLARALQSPLWQPLRQPRFRRLWAGASASLLADQAFFVTLTLLVLQVAGPGAELGAVLAVAAIPGAVLLPFGGWLADRVAPAAVMALASGGRALLMAALALLVIFDAVALWQLYLLGGLLSALDALYYPASLSIVPTLIDDDRLEPANALVQGAEQLSGLAGPALAAAIVGALGLGAAFSMLAFVFGVAAVAFGSLVRSGPLRPTASTSSAAESGVSALLAGARYAWSDPLIRTLLFVVAALNVAMSGPLLVGGVTLATERFGGPGAFGILMATFGGGSLIGAAAAGVLSRIRRRGVALLLVTATLGIGMALLGLAPSLAAAAPIAIVMGAGAGYLGVVLIAWLQERIAPELRGRVMSLVVFAAVALDPLSFALTGYLIESGITGVFFGAGALLGLTALLGAASRTVRAFH